MGEGLRDHVPPRDAGGRPLLRAGGDGHATLRGMSMRAERPRKRMKRRRWHHDKRHAQGRQPFAEAQWASGAPVPWLTTTTSTLACEPRPLEVRQIPIRPPGPQIHRSERQLERLTPAVELLD
jgi:hypothetical protein